MADRMLIESAMPDADAVIAVHTVVAAVPVSTYQAARSLDFLTVRTPLLIAAMWLRALPARLLRAAPEAPPQLRPEDTPADQSGQS